MEDMQKICNALAKTLQLTREYSDLDFISYHETSRPDITTVYVYWKNSVGGQMVNVSLDSGAAMIRDILSAIR